MTSRATCWDTFTYCSQISYLKRPWYRELCSSNKIIYIKLVGFPGFEYYNSIDQKIKSCLLTVFKFTWTFSLFSTSETDSGDRRIFECCQFCCVKVWGFIAVRSPLTQPPIPQSLSFFRILAHPHFQGINFKLNILSLMV